MIDSNILIRSYLVTQEPLTNLVGTRIFCPKIPENCTLPAISFNTRGGKSDPYNPSYVVPSVQFSCWGNTPQEARSVYGCLYDALQGLQNWGNILSVTEDVQGQDLEDPTILNYYQVLTFFSFIIKAS
jgi:hypothetical protein